MRDFLTKKTGFTLIELLVVITIIGMLATLLLYNFNDARLRTRDAQRKSDLRQIKSALSIYYSVWEEYPIHNTDYDIVGCGDGETPTVCTWGEAWTREGEVYIKPLPNDPLSDQSYYYEKKLSADSFILKAVLENKSDKEIGETQAKCDAGVESEYVVCQD